ncbi:hypothetical protein KR093_000552, partial [Drosophila rubida]
MYSHYTTLNINLRVDEDANSFPTFTLPKNVGVYSVSREGQFENFNSRMRFFEPSVTCPFSLRPTENLSPDTDIDLTDNESYLDTLLLFLTSSKERYQMTLDADIICSRDVLVLLMCTPYHSNKKWSIAISRYRNTIYMCQVPDEEEIQSFDLEHMKKLMKNTWLKKLRHHCLVLDAIEMYEQREESGQLIGVFTMGCDGLRLLFDAPVIAEKPNQQFTGRPLSFVDLQLRSDTMSAAEWKAHYRNEASLWWAQCFLIGIKTLYLALHDRELIVHRINSIKPEVLHRESNDWSGNVSGNFLSRFLKIIKQLMASVDSANCVYILEFDPAKAKFVYKVAMERNEHTFIPDWYRKQCHGLMDHRN